MRQPATGNRAEQRETKGIENEQLPRAQLNDERVHSLTGREAE